MFHFPSSLQSQSHNGSARKSDSLNATQQRPSTNPLFLKIEEELHDARRVHSDGQEDDLRYALNMVINRVTELSSMLSEAYKAQAELEVQLNVTKSNLKLVIANNEMLEDALKQNTTQSKDVGWRRTSTRLNGEIQSDPRGTLERSQSVDLPISQEPMTPPSAGAVSNPSTTSQENRFFKFRFSSGSAAPAQKPASSNTRPGTPTAQNPAGTSALHLTSPSMPSLSILKSKEVEDLTAELEKEKSERKKIVDEKAALEAELESLSQALFEEANKMVSDERKARAEIEDELKEVKTEKEALRSALRLIEGENTNLRTASALPSPQPLQLQQSSTGLTDPQSSPSSPTPTPTEKPIASSSHAHSRSSSEVAIKSRPHSLDLSPTLQPLPPSEPTSPGSSSYYEGLPGDEDIRLKDKGSLFSPDATVMSPEEELQPTPRFDTARAEPVPPTAGVIGQTGAGDDDDAYLGLSPWADVPSVATQPPKSAPATSRFGAGKSTFVAASMAALR